MSFGGVIAVLFSIIILFGIIYDFRYVKTYKGCGEGFGLNKSIAKVRAHDNAFNDALNRVAKEIIQPYLDKKI